MEELNACVGWLELSVDFNQPDKYATLGQLRDHAKVARKGWQWHLCSQDGFSMA